MPLLNARTFWAWIAGASLLWSMGCRRQPAQPAERPGPTASAQPPRVGGADVVQLVRKATSGGSKPEFLSVTLFPGRGMNLFQITANLPGKGEIPLLRSPTIAEAAGLMNGSGKDQWGNASHSFGGAFLIPYPNLISGKPSEDGQEIVTEWRGHALSLPANWQGKNPGSPRRALHGLILSSRAEELHTLTTTDGQTETAVIHAGDFNGHWLSNTDLTFNIALTGGAIDLAITARNVGKVLEPMAIGWHPYFAIPSGDRSQARLHVPASMVMEANDAVPTGQLKPVKGTLFDFESPQGVPLGNHDFNNNLSHLQRTSGAADAWMSDPKSNYGIHVKALSPEIRTLQIYAPADRPFTAIEDQFNYPDPFAPQWRGMDTGMVTLRPGQSVTWKVRLELFTPEPAK
ncbi:MAG TPA: aldose 1-epimerase [Acidobacteriaceae bacterium]|nr:aldose 1-epimerase [Acidobacteriaceae bacterium]